MLDFKKLFDQLGERSNNRRDENPRVIDNPIELRSKDGEVVLTGAELSEQLNSPAGLLSHGNTQVTLHIYDPFVDWMKL